MVLRNIKTMYKGALDLGLHPYLCFASMGTGYTGFITLKVSYTHALEGGEREEVLVLKAWQPTPHSWQHICVHLRSDILNPRLSSLADSIDEIQTITVKQIDFDIDYSSYSYMDEVTISSSEVDIKRSPPAVHDNVRIEKVEVVTEDSSTVTITLVPWTCRLWLTA